jgi:hypothetical protein
MSECWDEGPHHKVTATQFTQYTAQSAGNHYLIHTPFEEALSYIHAL